MALADIVDVQIATSAVTPARASFGTPLLFAHHDLPGARVREFASLGEAEEAGFTADDFPFIHRALSAIFSQRPRPQTVKLGRRSVGFLHTLQLTPTVTDPGFVYKLNVNGEAISYQVGASETAASISTALAALVDEAPGVSAVVVGDALEVAATSEMGLVRIIDLSRELAILDVSEGDTGLAADLSAIETDDSDWYGLILDAANKAAIETAAGWIETRRKMYVARTNDSDCTDPLSTTDTLASLQASGYARTVPCFHTEPGEFVDAGLLSGRLTADPGSDTWVFKGIDTVRAYRLTTAEEKAILDKNGTTFTVIAGMPMTKGGKTSSGEWADTTRGIDWLIARIQESVIFLLRNNPKIAYTDAGVDVIRSEVLGRLQDGVDVGFLKADPAPVVTAPQVADVDPIDRANRVFPGIEFEAYLAGAIHAVRIRGTLRS